MSQLRKVRADSLARSTVARIVNVMPPGIAAWDPAWDMVAEADRRFVELLGKWEKTGAAEDERVLMIAAERLVHEWERASSAYLTSSPGPGQLRG